jgi:hypothetical protein
LNALAIVSSAATVLWSRPADASAAVEAGSGRAGGTGVDEQGVQVAGGFQNGGPGYRDEQDGGGDKQQPGCGGGRSRAARAMARAVSSRSPVTAAARSSAHRSTV